MEIVLLVLPVKHLHHPSVKLQLLRDRPLQRSPALPLGAVNVDDLIKLQSGRGLWSCSEALGDGSEDSRCSHPVPAVEVEDIVSAADASSSFSLFLQLTENSFSSRVNRVSLNNLSTHDRFDWSNERGGKLGSVDLCSVATKSSAIILLTPFHYE
uniref:Uncharacterized protein n=1 Tax=Arundo donax TaxID=35708 RepID=A0A0A9BVI0_ARUDO